MTTMHDRADALLAAAAPFRAEGPNYCTSIDMAAIWVEEALAGRRGRLTGYLEELDVRLSVRGVQVKTSG